MPDTHFILTQPCDHWVTVWVAKASLGSYWQWRFELDVTTGAKTARSLLPSDDVYTQQWTYNKWQLDHWRWIMQCIIRGPKCLWLYSTISPASVNHRFSCRICFALLHCICKFIASPSYHSSVLCFINPCFSSWTMRGDWQPPDMVDWKILAPL